MPSAANTPKNWPHHLVYLTNPIYGKSVQAAQLHQRAPDPKLTTQKHAKGPCLNIQIQAIVDIAHPAYAQHGLFATRNLPPDTFICFYLGFVHGTAETDPASKYDLSLDSDLQIGVDATTMGNEGRFINDYRAVRPEGPNAEFRDCLADLGGGLCERRIGVFVLSPGKREGSELKALGKARRSL